MRERSPSALALFGAGFGLLALLAVEFLLAPLYPQLSWRRALGIPFYAVDECLVFVSLSGDAEQRTATDEPSWFAASGLLIDASKKVTSPLAGIEIADDRAGYHLLFYDECHRRVDLAQALIAKARPNLPEGVELDATRRPVSLTETGFSIPEGIRVWRD